MPFPLVLAWIPAAIVLSVDEATGLTAQDRGALEALLANAVEDQTGLQVERGGEGAAEQGVRTGLKVVIDGGATRIVVEIQRLQRRRVIGVARAEAGRDPQHWPALARTLASQLFPEGKDHGPRDGGEVVLPSEPASAEGQRPVWLSPVMLGTALVATVGGSVLAFTSASTKRELESDFIMDERLSDLESGLTLERGGAVALLGLALGLAGGALVLEFLD